MPKAFSPREKGLIEQTLIEKGKELFARHGLRKTNVEDLTRAAGISKGAFYKFYESKEELFFAIVEQQEEEFRRNIFAEVYQPGQSPRQSLKELLHRAFSLWASIPLLQDFRQEEYQILLRKLPPEKVQAHARNDDRFIAEFLEYSRQQGVEIQCDPLVVSGLMRALFYVSFHKDDFTPEAYPPTIATLIDLVVDHLIKD